MTLNYCLEQEGDLIRKHSEDEARCADRPQHLNLLQAANKREYEVLFCNLYIHLKLKFDLIRRHFLKE
jgi:hypothetical protein